MITYVRTGVVTLHRTQDFVRSPFILLSFPKQAVKRFTMFLYESYHVSDVACGDLKKVAKRFFYTDQVLNIAASFRIMQLYHLKSSEIVSDLSDFCTEVERLLLR